MASFESLLSAYDYRFPETLIAKEPVSPRDSAKLLVYDRVKDSVSFDTFANICSYLPEDCVVVFNKTKVIPAKMTLKKYTGGMISALYLETIGDAIRVLASGSIKQGDVLRWKEGLKFTVRHRHDQQAVLVPSFALNELLPNLIKFGETPLPPYMKDSPLPEERRRREYQTVFAFNQGSVAAPTAGLHFTEELIKKIAAPRTQGSTGVQSGRSVEYITLHVGLGTFAHLTKEQVEKNALHEEPYSIDPETADRLVRAKQEGRKIVAVGTTTVRTLESAAYKNVITRPEGSTKLFMTESTPPKFVDCLITNFHVPKSSLLMLVSAFTGRKKLLELYEKAIEAKMRLFSFGDGMLIL